ncbi:MAG TPA: glycogen debranching protein GlgX [Fibrobacteria bacterium]|nr:glycogen debranching protein GlgX [Fibrobacteria bacterium]
MNLQDSGATGAPSPVPPRTETSPLFPASPAGFANAPVDAHGAPLTIVSCRTGRLGAEVLENGVRFAVYSEHADAVHLALFPPGSPEGGDPYAVLPLPDCRSHVFMGFVPGIGPGWQYGFYAEGPFDPRHGHRFNPRKFLIDPYARALAGRFRNDDGILCGHVPGAGLDADLLRDHRPSHAGMPRGVIVAEAFDWQGVEAPAISRDDLVIYEVHVRGFTRDASSGVAAPGTFTGLIEKIPYLKSLGVNAVELLPVHAKYSEDLLQERGLSNYWGYNSASFFALEPSYGTGRAPGCELDEFKTMVRELHRAGILVLLDVVYNHTAEGSERGPTLSLRGLDNRSYYALTGPEDAPARYYLNHTGCGNTVDFGSAPVIRLVMDSLRYFAAELRVDGFRFDLATVHGRRGSRDFAADAPFFTAVAQDPVLSHSILIAEPWDVSAHGTGRFPRNWMEWNDDFRDIIRRWVRGDHGLPGAVREKLEGSPALYAPAGREPWTSVNFVTAHDGFTLRDLVTYGQKYNFANGEDNRDGSSDNHNWNCGHEGPGGGPAVEALRMRQARNLLLLTLLARGTPMLLGGDEFLRTQGGNNNAYCQDNPVSWFDWTMTRTEPNRPEGAAGEAAAFLRFTREAIAWRRLCTPRPPAPPRHRTWERYWQGFTAAGKAWTAGQIPGDRHAALLMHAASASEGRPPGPQGHPADAGTPPLYLLLNGEDEAVLFYLPLLSAGWEWRRVADTSLPSPEDITPAGEGVPLVEADRYPAGPRSVVLLRACALNPLGPAFPTP